MNPDTHSRTGELEIEKVRGPFRNVVPTRIMGHRNVTREKILIAGSPEMKAEFPRMRADMLQLAFEVFVRRLDGFEARFQELNQPHVRSHVAVFVSLMSLFEESVRHAAAHVPAFMQTLQLYDAGHNGRGFSPGTRSGTEELMTFTTHGTGVMMGLYRVVPHAFSAKHGRMPTAEELRPLVPACAEPMFSALTRVKGAYAVDVEERLGMHRQFFGYEDSTFAIPEFLPGNFVLRTVDGEEVLDVTENVTR